MTAPDTHPTDPVADRPNIDRPDNAVSRDRTLADLDRDLVYLLDQRLKLLRDRPAAQTPIAIPEAAIAETQLPGYIWRSLDTACRAAVITRPSLPSRETSRHITIIGGRGVMGRFFAQRLTHFGHRVAVLSRTDWAQADEMMANTDLVLFCVPIDRTIEIIQQLAPAIPPTAAIADITSIKSPPTPGDANVTSWPRRRASPHVWSRCRIVLVSKSRGLPRARSHRVAMVDRPHGCRRCRFNPLFCRRT
ncbi:MAG: prephenate dehydrogenase/arogenate dehydrogenase family protein [Coleofasciculaceae cyanobacterium RL_1_1]|nr:prephenate dehydrogenase/arogenate dehydrogenase family protein [Coleofasciculaceae cyanobacterium RL_1_1]